MILIILFRKRFVNIVEFHESKKSHLSIIITEFREKAEYDMKLNEAILMRIEEICKEQNSNICEICLKGGMSPSSIYDLAKGRTKCSKVITVKCFCEGAGITLSEFFNKDYFNEAEDD